MSALEILARTFSVISIPECAPQICDKCNPPRSGIYLLVDGDDVVYVGSSADVETRIFGHTIERRAVNVMARKEFDRVLWIALPENVLDYYEGAFIRALRPCFNRNAPRHSGYDNEILEGFGLEPHDDENANSREWLTDRPERTNSSAIATRIKYWRARRQMTQATLAEAIGISKAAVAQWESGQTTPKTSKVEAMATALGMSVAEFYGGAA